MTCCLEMTLRGGVSMSTIHWREGEGEAAHALIEKELEQVREKVGGFLWVCEMGNLRLVNEGVWE